MGKSNRGRGIIDKPNRGRGTCPVCETTGIKLLYDNELNKEPVKVCKRCRNK
ncbi:hypothetical protein PRVXH_000965 [Proteinivorax hydrogeniformans]|uniref:Uncharacterized protein n=1 Tax=Proteinivorax hydrogeniformans TaxID=1826727 RepID=A0AAU8HW63_9FIRM